MSNIIDTRHETTRRLLFLILVLTSLTTFAQPHPTPSWTSILNDNPESYRIQLVSSTENSIQVNVQVPGFYATPVNTPRGEAKIITLPKAASTAQVGEPDLPMASLPVIIGDRNRMAIRVVTARYRDFEGIEAAPSKGDLSRQIDPATVPYTYGDCYQEDTFFPAQSVGLYEPYIVRDFRGQNMVLYPFAYNPVSKTLRVYYDLTVEMYKVDEQGVNALTTRKSGTLKLDPDFKDLYQRHFINYEVSMSRYTPVEENGDLLIICHDSFIPSMTDFVNWKKTRGVNTTIVGTSTVGTSSSAIKAYIQNQYNANNHLTHVLLVGDVAQIPGYSYSGGGSYNGLGDNPYGQIVGNDLYNDVFIGRFSATNAAQVATQVQKVITYERDLTTSATWLQNGMGVSASAGNNGHYNEDDYVHINNIRTDLLNYGYSTVYQEYYRVSGYSSTTQQISTRVNSGVGIITYCNHGSETAWQSHSPYYSNSYVNALTNDNKLPFIFSVACLNGKYDHSSDCFAEAWMRATNNGAPAGAVGTLMSYISQPWVPPMWAEDEFIDILVESYSNNIKRTWGGTAINSLMSIFDHYSTSTAAAVGTYQAWILYGDPSMMLRTKTPQAMTVSHPGNINEGQDSYTVTVSNGDGALTTVTNSNHDILGTATVSNGVANILFNAIPTENEELTLCVFGYNKVTYLDTIHVIPNSPVGDSTHWTVVPGSYANNMTVLAVIAIDSEEQRSDELEVGAFCGDEVRGAAKALYCPPVDRYIVPLVVYGNSNDLITFKLYDPSLDMELETEPNTTYFFIENGYGSINEPTFLNFLTEAPPSPVLYTQQVELSEGWNWFSSYVEYDANALETLENTLSSLGITATIKSQSAFVTNDNTAGTWSGSLTSLDNTSMYMILLNQAATLTLTNVLATPENHPITLNAGWNWIANLSQDPIDISVALSGITPNHGDIIKGQDAFAQYDANNHVWYGTLNSLQPGKGYMYLKNTND